MLQFHPNKKRSVRRYANTRIVQNRYNVHVILHNTCVVYVYDRDEAHDGSGFTVQLNAVDPDGEEWQTPITKKRMNEVANELGLDFHVYQHNREWWVEVDKIQNPYRSGMMFNCTGRKQ